MEFIFYDINALSVSLLIVQLICFTIILSDIYIAVF